jgi:hypothetical protein
MINKSYYCQHLSVKEESALPLNKITVFWKILQVAEVFQWELGYVKNLLPKHYNINEIKQNEDKKLIK